MDAKQLTEQVINWTRNYLNSFGGETKAIIGISGGIDSSTAAALCVAAVGKERVIGILMPNGVQHDIDKSKKLVEFLQIRSYVLNISDIQNDYTKVLTEAFDFDSVVKNKVYYSNNPARVRMAMLYAVSAIIGNCRVCNTCNKSETYVGYDTRWGDQCGDFSPIGNIVKTDVKEIAKVLGLPQDLVEKPPEDGMLLKADGTYMTDEENFGFTYDVLDHYLKTGEIADIKTKDRIEALHSKSLFKVQPIPTFGNDDLRIVQRAGEGALK